MEPIELCDIWRLKLPILSVLTLILIGGASAALITGHTLLAQVLAVPLLITSVSICLITLLYELPLRVRNELALIFFRTLRHKWGRYERIGEGCEQQCERCGGYRHSLTLEAYGEVTRAEWQRGRYPRIVRAKDAVDASATENVRRGALRRNSRDSQL